MQLAARSIDYWQLDCHALLSLWLTMEWKSMPQPQWLWDGSGRLLREGGMRGDSGAMATRQVRRQNKALQQNRDEVLRY